MSNRLRRREMLRNTALAGVAVWLSSGSRAQGAGKSPNEKLNIAAIGVGGAGANNVNACASENIVALCDVDDQRAAKTFEKYPAAKKFRDFRKMLDEMHKQVDAVVISTPDHTHAPAAAMAMRMGKHCFCEKPLGQSVYETRFLTELAKKQKLVTQLGTQGHASENHRRVVELIESGAIGPVRQVEMWEEGVHGGYNRASDRPPIPNGLDWDLWLGPAPYRPYHPRYAPFGWRYWWDFGTGALGDHGPHNMDLPFWALKLRYPTSVDADGPPPNPESTPPVLTVRWEFPARGELPPVTITRLQGPPGCRPAIARENKTLSGAARGILFIGEKGILQTNLHLADPPGGDTRVLWPESQFADFLPLEPTIPASIGHHQEWLDACKTGRPTGCSFDRSGPLCEAVLLGNVAYRAQSKLEWDAKNLKATNCPEADKYIRREYRKGWTL